jgi:glycosidase
MNLLGTHDTPRILTALVDDFDGDRQQLATRRLSESQLTLAWQRLILASVLQFTLPGSPSIYYGDEALMEGGKDPFNRRTYPWGREDAVLLQHHRKLGQLRKTMEVLRMGDIHFFYARDGKLGFSRTWKGEKVRIYLNRGFDNWEIPAGTVRMHRNMRSLAPAWLQLAPMGFCITEDF